MHFCLNLSHAFSIIPEKDITRVNDVRIDKLELTFFKGHQHH